MLAISNLVACLRVRMGRSERSLPAPRSSLSTSSSHLSSAEVAAAGLAVGLAVVAWAAVARVAAVDYRDC